MSIRTMGRAGTLSLILVLLAAGSAAADTVPADGDAVTPGAQPTIALGPVAPGAELSVPVGFVLVCGNGSHADPGQTVTLTPGTRTEPDGGAILSASDGSVGPVPDSWPVDGELCPDPAPQLTTGAPSTVVVRAPAADGFHEYVLFYDRSLRPTGALDGSALRSATAVTIVVEVVANTPPVLRLPDPGTVEGDTTGGWIADWDGLAATDAEDEPDPIPACTPAAGTVLPLGTTTVACAVTDLGGLETTGTFDVTVVDTTAPSLPTLADRTVTTPYSTGATLEYDVPTATDLVDVVPTVACLPPAGTTIPVGTTTVTCTATDASGNAASESWDVTVRHVPAVVAAVTWGEPIGGADPFVANRGRTVPVKATITVGGVRATTGSATLRIVPCGGGTAVQLPLSQSAGRWEASIDTGVLPGGCHVVTAWWEGVEAGAFRLELRGAEAARVKGRGR